MVELSGIVTSQVSGNISILRNGRVVKSHSRVHTECTFQHKPTGVQINRQAAPPTGWEEFTVEDRGNNVICLKSVHGKYLSAQMDGTAQWNRDSAPKGGWEEIRFVPQVAQNQEPAPAQNQEPALCPKSRTKTHFTGGIH